MTPPTHQVSLYRYVNNKCANAFWSALRMPVHLHPSNTMNWHSSGIYIFAKNRRKLSSSYATIAYWPRFGCFCSLRCMHRWCDSCEIPTLFTYFPYIMFRWLSDGLIYRGNWFGYISNCRVKWVVYFSIIIALLQVIEFGWIGFRTDNRWWNVLKSMVC